jgi:hypothetical protein
MHQWVPSENKEKKVNLHSLFHNFLLSHQTWKNLPSDQIKKSSKYSGNTKMSRSRKYLLFVFDVCSSLSTLIRFQSINVQFDSIFLLYLIIDDKIIIYRVSRKRSLAEPSCMSSADRNRKYSRVQIRHTYCLSHQEFWRI